MRILYNSPLFLKGVLLSLIVFASSPAFAEGPSLDIIEYKNNEITRNYTVSIDDLSKLPQTTIETTTIWTEGVQTFVGPSFKTIVEDLLGDVTEVVAVAVNDYIIDIPIEHATENGPIFAIKHNGEFMTIRSKGPIWIIYPYDSDERFQTEEVYSRSVWQLLALEIER